MKETQASRLTHPAPIDLPIDFSEQWAREAARERAERRALERAEALAARGGARRAGRRGPSSRWLAIAIALSAAMIGWAAQQRFVGDAAEVRSGEAAPDPAALRAAATAEDADMFAHRLSVGYLDLAIAAYDRQAFGLTYFYARRAEAVGRKRLPAPLSVLGETDAEAASIRAELIDHLQKGPSAASPQALAEAQLGFDCWLREAMSDGARSESSRCRQLTQAALAALREGPDAETAMRASVAPPSVADEGRDAAARRVELSALIERWSPTLQAALRGDLDGAALAEPVAASLRTPLPGAAEAFAPIQAAAPAPKREVVLFAFGSASIDRAALQEALSRLELTRTDLGGRRIVLSGHADAFGAPDANLALSKRRAEAAAAALRSALGAAGAEIEIEAYGETRPLVSTPDGVREPRNRRVEIALL